MSENKGNKPIGVFVPVVSILAMVGIIMYMAYDWVSGMSRELHTPTGPGQQQAVEARIRPIGQVAIAGHDDGVEARVAAADEPAANGDGEGEDAPAANGDTEAADDGGEAVAEQTDDIDGAAIYQAACTVCHGAGIAGAPKTGETSAWASRLEQGMDTLVRHAIEGFQGDAGVMPPRGGQASLSDTEVRAAVQHMVDALD